ncbi:MAG: hypothetical protein ACE5G0_12035 [Rhodothermales bacterium]
MPRPLAFLPFLVPLFCGLLLGACADVGSNTQPVSAASEVGETLERAEGKLQSVTLDAIRAPGIEHLRTLRDMGVTHLTLIQFGFQPGYDVPEVRMNTDARWFSEGDSGIRILARQADSLGMRVILKPHIWVGEYRAGGLARDAIGFDTEADWVQWEGRYHAFMMHYAHLAREINAPLLVVGTELAHVARTRPDFWRRLIADVRQVYDGELTYAANWYEEYEDITFWDALDYIGVQAYFELSKAENPTLDMLREGWVPYKETMQRLSERVGLPVLFTEIGYRNVPSAAAEPWRWPSRDEIGTVQPDDTLQAHLYQIFFESLWHEDWFAGAVIWKWRPDTEERRRRRNYLDFSPQNKPAEQLIARWFSRHNASQLEGSRRD